MVEFVPSARNSRLDVIHPDPGKRLVYQVAPALAGREPLAPLFCSRLLLARASAALASSGGAGRATLPRQNSVSWAWAQGQGQPGTDCQGSWAVARIESIRAGKRRRAVETGEGGGETGCSRTGSGGRGRRMGAGNETQSAEVGRRGFVTASQDTRIFGRFFARDRR